MEGQIYSVNSRHIIWLNYYMPTSIRTFKHYIYHRAYQNYAADGDR